MIVSMTTHRAGESTVSGRAAESPAAGESRQVCDAPSCWDDGSVVTVAGRDIDDDPVLCETHRRAFLGVSS